MRNQTRVVLYTQLTAAKRHQRGSVPSDCCSSALNVCRPATAMDAETSAATGVLLHTQCTTLLDSSVTEMAHIDQDLNKTPQ